MPSISVDAMNDAAQWSAFAPDGVTPSSELTMSNDTERFRYGPDGKSGRIGASTSATGHLLRRSLPPLDLSTFDELRLWVMSDRVADGSAPFFLELRLASAAMDLANPGNTWQRLLPVSQRATWESVRLSLGDLNPAVRSAVSLMQLRCVDASTSFTCWLDDVIAVRDEMIGDVEGSLKARLGGQIIVNGSPVPAVVHASDVAETATPPYLLITQYDIKFSDVRTTTTRPRGDFTSTGYVLRPPSYGWDLYYQVEVFAGERSIQTRLLELVVRALGPRGELVVSGLPLMYEWLFVAPLALVGGKRTDRVALHYRILARQEVGTPTPVGPVRNVAITSDTLAG